MVSYNNSGINCPEDHAMTISVLNAILFELSDDALKKQRSGIHPFVDFGYKFKNVHVPSTYKKVFLTDEEYTRGTSAWTRTCVDIVIATRLPSGTPAVLSSRRKENVSFGGYWWMYGGAVPPYLRFETFIRKRAKEECGIQPVLGGLIGVYLTCAENMPTSTLQPCYVGNVPFEKVEQAQTDSNHDCFRLLTKDDLSELPSKERHWYPMHVFGKVLRSMP